MVAKWVIVVFLSFSAFFGSALRAADVRSVAQTAETFLGIEVEIDENSWILREKPTVLAALYQQMSTAPFREELNGLVEQCRIDQIKKIRVTSSASYFSGELTISYDVNDAVAFLRKTSKNCLESYALVALIESHWRPKKIEIDPRDIISGRFSTNEIAKWASELVGGRTKPLLNEFESECRHEIEIVRFDAYTSYYSRRAFDIGLKEKIGTVRSKLSATVRACRKLMKPLSELNIKYALNEGLLFKFQINDLLNSRITADQISAWIAYLATDQKRLRGLREAFIEAPESARFKGLVSDKGLKYILPIDLSIFNAIPTTEFMSIFFGMPFDLALSPIYLQAVLFAPDSVREIMEGRSGRIIKMPMSIDVTRKPGPVLF